MKEIFNHLPPKITFFLGVALAFLVLCTIGFFVLLGVTIKGQTQGILANAKTNGLNPAVGDNPVPSNAPAPSAPVDIKLAAITDKDHIRGNRNAKVTVVEFSDTECPFCKRFHPTMNQVIDTYGDKVAWVYKHFPLDSIHSKARKEAEASECAAELAGNDGFWKYLDRLFEITPSNDGLDLALLPKIAEDIGINRNKFEDCLNSGRKADIVAKHLAEAQAAGGNGTPYSIIVAGDEKIPVSGALPFAQLKAMIDPLVQ